MKDMCVELPQYGDDYASSTGKHWEGLMHMHEHHPSRFYHTCGTDTFLNVRNALAVLDCFDPTQCLYIGGHGCKRRIQGGTYKYHSGGPGYFLSHGAMNKVARSLPDYLPQFLNADHEPLRYCDVQAGYLSHKLGLEYIDVENRFWHCNIYGLPCHPGQVCWDTLVACHLMSNDDMACYNAYLNQMHPVLAS